VLAPLPSVASPRRAGASDSESAGASLTTARCHSLRLNVLLAFVMANLPSLAPRWVGNSGG
jgi:hypothetical protein